MKLFVIEMVLTLVKSLILTISEHPPTPTFVIWPPIHTLLTLMLPALTIEMEGLAMK